MPFYRLGWDMSVALYMAAGLTNDVLALNLCGALTFMVGAIAAPSLVGYLGGMRKTAMLGTLMMVPFLFVYWAFVTTAVVNIHVLNGYFWRGLLTGCVATMGHGILMSCAVGYLGRSYSFSNNGMTGRAIMNFSFVYPLGVLVYILMLCAYNTDLNAAVVGACCAVLSAVVWWRMEPCDSDAQDNAFSMWD